MRPIRELSVTIPKFEGDRDLFEEWIVECFDGAITRYAVALEEHYDGTPHLHAYVQLPNESEELPDPPTADTFTASLTVWLDKGCDVQACRSVKTWLKYITKEDQLAILRQVSPHECSLYLQTAILAKKRAFRWNDPHVAAHANTAHVVRNMWEAFREENEDDVSCSMVPYPLPLAVGEFTWMRNAVAIINNYIAQPDFKRPHLYLWGEPNSGKSTFVNCLLDLMGWTPVFPLKFKSSFWLSQIDKTKHVILMDDFRPDDYVESELLNLLQGGYMSRQKKGQDPTTFRWRKPIILTSNVAFADLSEPLRVRLRPVKAFIPKIPGVFDDIEVID